MKMVRLAAGIACLSLAGAVSPPAHATAPNVVTPEPAPTWGPCPEAWTGPAMPELGQRLTCGSMAAPLDHEAPNGHMLEIGAIRVSAAAPALREGAIFLHSGGPGAHPGKLLQILARAWSESTDPYKRRLAERFDLVAVIPRGLVGSGELRCVTGLPPSFAFLPGDLGDANWSRVLTDAQTIVDACRAPSHARYINTEQHAHDMDMYRRALGDERIHFYGISHGALVGAWYASIYPTHIGRMLWDSPFDVSRDYAAALQGSMVAQHEEIVRKAIAPILRDPARYGFASDPTVVSDAVTHIHSRLRELRVGAIESPEELAATIHLSTLLAVHAPQSLDALLLLLRRPLSTDPVLDARMRYVANQLAALLYAPVRNVPSFHTSPDGDSVRVVVPCNDMPWTRTEAEIRETARENARRYLSMTGHEAFDEVLCLRWGRPTARPMVRANIDRAAPFLMLQSERDALTPLAGGMNILDRFANARMLLVRNAGDHGLFNFTRSPCIERTAARYLATGELPETGSRVFACEGTHGKAADSMPGEPSPPFVEPVAMPQPGATPPATPTRAPHDEM